MSGFPAILIFQSGTLIGVLAKCFLKLIIFTQKDMKYTVHLKLGKLIVPCQSHVGKSEGTDQSLRKYFLVDFQKVVGRHIEKKNELA